MTGRLVTVLGSKILSEEKLDETGSRFYKRQAEMSDHGYAILNLRGETAQLLVPSNTTPQSAVQNYISGSYVQPVELFDYSCGTLSEPDMINVAEHLKKCRYCREDALPKIDGFVTFIRELSPLGYKEKLLKQLLEEIESEELNK